MRSIIVILALAMALASAVVFAEEVATATSTEEAVPAECFVDEDGDTICDKCGITAEECAAKTEGEGCADCANKCDDSDKVEEDKKDK